MRLYQYVFCILLVLLSFCGFHISCAQDATVQLFDEKASLAKANMIYNKLQQGEDFQILAQTYSDDPGSARVGGNLGLASKGHMVRKYEKTALSLEPGEISKPIRTEFGYHIIQLLEKKGKTYRSRHILVRTQ